MEHAEERRQAPDGRWYTWKEFVQYYNPYSYWNRAALETVSPAASQRGSGRAAATEEFESVQETASVSHRTKELLLPLSPSDRWKCFVASGVMVWELRFRAAVWVRGDGDNGDSETDLTRRLAFVNRHFSEKVNIADK